MKYLSLSVAILLSFTVSSQSKLQPGFDPKEYSALLSLAFNRSSIADSIERRTAKDPYHMEYRSPEIAFKNRWTLYLRNDNVAVIDLRGTVNQSASWLANVYAAMIPATGDLQINDSTVFHYQFAADSKALVHVGWSVSIAHLAPDVENKINWYYKNKNIKDFLISGHSQGGALATLMRSWLEYERQKGKIPADVVFKTYCSAAPKTGNMYYAYDFDFITRGGWAFTVVNAADWVPEAPFSIQTLQDFNPVNPLVHSKEILKKQKFMIRFAGNMVYDKLEKKPRKAQKKFEKYIGHVVYKKAVRKVLPQLKEPVYSHSNNYMRAGTPVILMPDAEYYQKFPQNSENLFIHHMFISYYTLLKKWYKVE